MKIVLASYFTTSSPEQLKQTAFHLPLTAGTMLLISDIKTTFRLQKPHCENF